MQSVRYEWLDLAASIVSVGGHSAVAAGLALGLVAARVRARAPDWWVPLLLAGVVAIEATLKLVVYQPGPPPEGSRAIELLPALPSPFVWAFPSGHVARVSFLAAVAHIPAWIAGIAVVLIAVTRPYLGEHWPSDVLGGALLGLGVASAGRFRRVSRSPVGVSSS